MRSAFRAVITALLAVTFAACSHHQFVVVTVMAAAGVTLPPIRVLHVSFDNEGIVFERDIDGGADIVLPTNFSGGLPANRTGMITVTVEARDAAGAPVADGAGSATLDPSGLTSIIISLSPAVPPVCGDGTVDAGEECDDGNTMGGDGCSPSCVLETGPVCGDGNVDVALGEECDDANAVATDDCTDSCRLPVCGDGIVWSDGTGVEECEDTDPTSNLDGCFADCSAPGPTPSIGLADAEFASATVHGASSGDSIAARFGLTTPITSGDFNGDGIDDLAIGAPLADGPGESRPDAGEVYVIFGGDYAPGTAFDAAGTDFTPVNATIFGKSPSAFFGAALAAGDVDGDGIDDLVIGAPQQDVGLAAPRVDAGEAYVVLGSGALAASIDLATALPYLTVQGASANDQLGMGVATGLVNADGLADLVIGAPFGDGPGVGARMDGGEVAVIFSTTGTRDLAAVPPDSLLFGGEAGDNFGMSVAAGDFDGDTFADVVTAARFADGPANGRTDAGEVYVFRGAAALPAIQDVVAGTHDLILLGGAFDNFGSVAVADLNGDGLDDVVAGGPGNSGHVVAFLGRPLPGPGALTLDVTAAVPQVELNWLGFFNPVFGSSGLGFEVTASDLDADGALDVVTSASNWETPIGTTGAILAVVDPPLAIGSVTSYSLDPTVGPLPEVTIMRPVGASSPLGAVGIGDFDHDGFDDLATAIPGMSSGAGGSRFAGGLAFVYFAGPGALVPAGVCVNGVDDDGDGATDLDDPGCTDAVDDSELLGTTCDNGMDDDSDGITDFPFDPGCATLADADETDPTTPPECANGTDDDSDMLIDFPADPGCDSAADDGELHCLYDFAGGSAMTWTFSNTCTTAPVGWTIDSFRSVSPSSSLYYGNPGARNFDCPVNLTNSGTATSGPITIPASGTSVRFFFFAQSESCSPTSGFDIVSLSVVPTGGSLPTQVWRRCDSPDTGSGMSTMFDEVTVDLSAFAGQVVQLQFFQDTLDGAANMGEGFYVDDIVLGASCP